MGSSQFVGSVGKGVPVSLKRLWEMWFQSLERECGNLDLSQCKMGKMGMVGWNGDGGGLYVL